MTTADLPVAVIGAGPVGLTAAAHLLDSRAGNGAGGLADSQRMIAPFPRRDLQDQAAPVTRAMGAQTPTGTILVDFRLRRGGDASIRLSCCLRRLPPIATVREGAWA